MTGVPQELELLVFLTLLALSMFGASRLLGRWSQDAQSAEDKARAVLHEFLSADERRYLERFACLMVPSPSMPKRTYCIPARPGMVAVYESGRQVMRLCLQPTESLPTADLVLMLKLMIEGNEEEYLRTANVQPSATTFR